MRRGTQSDLMTQHHRETPFFCHLKNSRKTLTKHSIAPSPHLLENNSPYPLQSLQTTSLRSKYFKHIFMYLLLHWCLLTTADYGCFKDFAMSVTAGWTPCYNFRRRNPAACALDLHMDLTVTASVAYFSLTRHSLNALSSSLLLILHIVASC